MQVIPLRSIDHAFSPISPSLAKRPGSSERTVDGRAADRMPLDADPLDDVRDPDRVHRGGVRALAAARGAGRPAGAEEAMQYATAAADGGARG
jgi:hypothetical protein